MAQAFYYIVTTIVSPKGETSVHTTPLGVLKQDFLLDVTLAFSILDYSTGLMRDLRSKGYQIAKIDDEPHSGFRKITLSDSSVITISTDAKEGTIEDIKTA